MAKFKFYSARITEFEDVIEAPTIEDAQQIFDELIVDDLTQVNQFFRYDVVEVGP